MTKSYRQGQILKLIRTQNISTQEDLAVALKQVGVDATQVTLSRDIREMGLVKTADGYRALPPQERPEDLDVRGRPNFCAMCGLAQNQIVLRTAPGHASSVAVALDSADWPRSGGHAGGRRYGAGDLPRRSGCGDRPCASYEYAGVGQAKNLRTSRRRGTL